jgi:hypothetical protein
MVVKYTNPNKAKNTKDIYFRLKINILVEGRKQRGCEECEGMGDGELTGPWWGLGAVGRWGVNNKSTTNH